MNKPHLKVAYFGTPDYSARFLEKILADTYMPVHIEYVVTQPDMPIGRKQIVTASAVKEAAIKHKIPVLHDIDLEKLHSLDFALLFAYGEILTAEQLSAPKNGFWNVHLSLLPAFRGASPTVYPLILGEKTTGATLTKMDPELDHGPIIAQQNRPIDPHITNVELINLLADDMFELLHGLLQSGKLPDIGQVEMNAQDHAAATFTRTLTRQDGFIPFTLLQKGLRGNDITAEELPELTQDYLRQNHLTVADIPHHNAAEVVYNLWRGLTPWPGVWTIVELSHEGSVETKRLKLLNFVMQGNELILETVQLEGKNPIPFVQIQASLGL